MICTMTNSPNKKPKQAQAESVSPASAKPRDTGITQLLEIMAHLRDPHKGCPWDKQQDFTSIAPYTVEEAYEVADAIAAGDMAHLKEELGDLLFQVAFHSQMAAEGGHFDFADVVKALNEKMVQRHPHVFDPQHPPLTARQQTAVWEQRKHANKVSVLDDIPANLSGLLRAVKLQKRAASIGFDWPDVAPVFDKLDEEVAELKEAMASGDKARMQDELGDVLFVITNLARHIGVDPELALRQANNKFEKRFRQVEKKARQHKSENGRYALDTLDKLWDQVKAEQGDS